MRSSQGHIEDVCKISRAESKKRLGHFAGEIKLGFFNVNRPVYITVDAPFPKNEKVRKNRLFSSCYEMSRLVSGTEHGKSGNILIHGLL